MARLNLSLLGPFVASVDGRPISNFRTKATQALLIYLACQPDQAHRRDHLMTLLTPGLPKKSAQANLRQTLYQLRQVLSATAVTDNGDPVPFLLSDWQTIQINPEAACEVDVLTFESALQAGESRWDAAVELYRGDFLVDFYLPDNNAFEEWAEAKRQAYRHQALETLERLTAVAIRRTAYTEARAYAERQIEIDNLRENAYRQLMKILALNGQRAEALALYETCQRLFTEELGMAPTTRTTEIAEQIRAGDLSFATRPTQDVRGFELKEKIGEGAYGAIYRAIQAAVDREVAVKVIRRQYADDPAFIRRFESEAQTIARLEHPHIVPLYDYWRDPEGAFLVMRLLRGGNLLSALESGPWAVASVMTMLDQIASALAAAHRQGVIHRDIKPANILFDEAGNAYLSDFGIAKQLTGDLQLTAAGGILGTPDYISPEQLRDEPVGPTADLYSLGAVLYETLTGKRPFPDIPLAMLLQKQMEKPIPPVSASRPDLPPQIDSVIQRATAKQPADRYSDALALAQAFRQAARGQDVIQPVVVETAVPVDIEIVNPYKGLRAFQEADAADFYGRETLIEQLVTRLAESRFLAVVGPSGSGKSSAVKAGLIPALRQKALPGSDKWFVAEMTPGSHPLEELELALLPIAVDPPPSLLEPLQKDERGLLRIIRRILPDEDRAQLLLVIDQFEELFTLVDEDVHRRYFLDSLLTALNAPRSSLRVVVTLRADFYDRPLQYQPIGELFKQHTEVILPLTQDELTWAIQEPARRVGVGIEEGVVAAMTTDIADQPGALPLLQYALTELFEERQDHTMTLAAYRAIGGVSGALARRAEELYANLDKTKQEDIRQLFLRLVTLGEGMEDTRRRVRLSELSALKVDDSNSSKTFRNLDEVKNLYGRHRILTFDRDPTTREPTIEVAHEALLREWPRLRRWLDESRDDIRMQRRLAAAAAEWEQSNHDEGFLLQGSRLDMFSGWRANSHMALTSTETTFLNFSLVAQQQRQAAEEARQKRELEAAQKLAQEQSDRAAEQAHSASRLRWLATGLAVILLLAIGAAWLAAVRGQEAQTNANLAATSEAAAVDEAKQRATAQVVADEERDMAVRAEATAVAAGIRADEQREAAMVAEAIAIQERQAAEMQAQLAFSRELAAAALNSLSEDQERAVLLAIQALAQAHTQEAEDALHRTAQELRLLYTLDAPGKSPFVALSPDGRLLITSGANGATVWDAAAGTIIYELNVGHYINRAAFSPDGTLLILPYENTSEENPEGYLEPSAVSIIDAETGEERLTFLAHDAWVQDVSFSPDGSLFATASGDGTVKVWDLAATLTTGEGREQLNITGETFFWIVYFSPDGTRLATVNDDGVIQIWDAATGEELLRINAETYSLAFSPDGTRLVSGSWTGMLNVYDAFSGERLSSILAHDNMVMYIMFSADGTRVASTGDDTTVKVWAFAEDVLSPLLTLAGHKGKTTTAEFSPDGERLFSGSSESAGGDITVRIWDISPAGSVEPIFYPHKDTVNGLTFNPDGDRLVTAGADGSAIIWDVASGQARHTLSGHDWVWRVVYSPDGSLLATAGRDATAKLWDAVSGQELSTLTDHFIQDETEFYRGVLGLAFSPDGGHLATAGGDGHVRIWNVAALRAGNLAIGEEMLSLNTQAEGEFGQFAMDVSFSPDGHWIAAVVNNWADDIGSYGNGNVKVWDATTGELLWNIGGEAEKTYLSITFSPDKERLAAGTLRGEATVWRLPDNPAGTPVELFSVQVGRAFVLKMHFSPDGTQLAIPHMDGMGIWDANTGEFLKSFPHPGSVMEVVYAHDGKRLATAGFDGFGRLFITDVDELIALARARLTRSLTDAECQRFLHVAACPERP